ncbi:hypothetical protein JCM33374_g571 [Metschnikowia sp. JCM 33374]|nr:hypothetical protein JCM33374_g571 [Metschnikowia sp. JCM 33374]
MNLMHLGVQSRKTGIKPKENLAKDRHDMEDIDEFFNESSWSMSKLGTVAARRDVKPRIESKPEKTLGIRRQPSIKTPATSSVLYNKKSENTTRHINIANNSTNLSEDRYAEIEASVFEDFDPSFDNPPLNDEIKNWDLSNSSSPKGKPSNRHSDKRNVSSRLTKDGSPRQVHANVSKITKNMALKEKRKALKSEADFNESLGNISSSSDESFSSVTDSQDSKKNNSQSVQVHQTTQDYSQPVRSLPSPPPEGLRRSKRTKIAPLAYWRNERIVYTRARENSADPDSTLIRDIRKVPLQEIVEVIHVPEKSKQVPGDKSKRAKKKAHSRVSERKSESTSRTFDYESDPEIEGSEWFKQKCLESEVFENDEKMTSRTIAWAPSGGNFQSPPVPKDGSSATENFQVASLFDQDSNVFAAGLLDFPVEGFKSLRTTGESSFVFHVAKGLIEVTLNSNKFVVTRGCSFEIPKYNIYSFKNLGNGAARLFFVQCQVSES